MKSIKYQQIILLIILNLLHLGSSLCELPQKAVYFSFDSLANRDELSKLFQQLPHSSFNLQHIQEKRVYSIVNLSYELLYNGHYQREQFVDKETIDVVLGPISIISKFNYTVANGDKIQEKGTAFARSNLDYTSFKKKIITLDGYLQWDPITIQKITFTSLWVIQSSYQLSEDNQYIIQSILNNHLGNNGLNKKIEKEINQNYPNRLKSYLNQEKLLSLTDIIYQYNQIDLNITHYLTAMNLIEGKGLQIYFKFGLNSSKQVSCPKLPSFNQSQFGGIQQILTFSSIKQLVSEGIQKGLYNVVINKAWQVEMFQLYMGDLANAVSYADNLPANSPLFISCQSTNNTNITIFAFDSNRIYIELTESCIIKNSQTQLIKLEMQLITLALLEAQNHYLSVKIDKFQTKGIKFISLDPRFVVDNLQIGKIIVNNILDGLAAKECFGSKFPILQRKYPGLFIRGEYLVIFDHSQISI